MKIIRLFIILALPVVFSACEGVKEDAKDTPIGSVISGKTKNTETYMQRVRTQNKSVDKDVWRPESPDRF